MTSDSQQLLGEAPPSSGMVQPPLAPAPRTLRWLNLFVMGVVLLTLLAGLSRRLATPADLAKNKPWRASSSLYPCFPDRIYCGGVRTAIFFHTQEENEPWVELDLKEPTTFSTVEVTNRRDGFQERASPLALEASDNQSDWRTLAETNATFSVWKPSFAKTTARFIRLRAKRQTFLHLEGIRVMP